jgi:hypothetical protein
MNSKADGEQLLHLDRDLRVTSADVDALRRLRSEAPSWLTLDWRTLDELVGPDTLARRPLARDTWAPFTLE